MTTSQSAQATRESSSAKQLQIDVWGDLACPFCYIGKSRLDKAIASSLHPEAITVRHHSYELDPEMPYEPRPNLEIVAAKYGMSLAQAERMEDQVVALAHREGLPLPPTAWWPTVSTSTESCNWPTRSTSTTSCLACSSRRCSAVRATPMTTRCLPKRRAGWASPEAGSKRCSPAMSMPMRSALMRAKRGGSVLRGSFHRLRRANRLLRSQHRGLRKGH
jgi:hypothetical protein